MARLNIQTRAFHAHVLSFLNTFLLMILTGLLSVCTGAYPKSNTKALVHDKGFFFLFVYPGTFPRRKVVQFLVSARILQANCVCVLQISMTKQYLWTIYTQTLVYYMKHMPFYYLVNTHVTVSDGVLQRFGS